MVGSSNFKVGTPVKLSLALCQPIQSKGDSLSVELESSKIKSTWYFLAVPLTRMDSSFYTAMLDLPLSIERSRGFKLILKQKLRISTTHLATALAQKLLPVKWNAMNCFQNVDKPYKMAFNA